MEIIKKNVCVTSEKYYMMIGGVNPSGPGLRYRCHAKRKPLKTGSR